MTGIYQITCSVSNKIYIGSSVNVKKRWRDHRSALRKKSHVNPHLQSAWCKYGEESFVFELVEEVSKNDHLLEREQWWLDRTKSYDRNTGYNINVVATNYSPVCKYIVKHPDGKETEVINLEQFCRDNGLHATGLHNVASGRSHQYKGFKCRRVNQSEEDWLKTCTRSAKSGTGWKGDWIITHPDGKEEIVSSLYAFCKANGFSHGGFRQVLTGRLISYKGYRCKKCPVV